MEKFITEVKADKYSFQCLRCKDNKGKKGKILQVNSLKSHITSNEHKKSTPNNEMEEYEALFS